MQTPSMLPMDVQVSATPAKPATSKDAGKSADKSPDSFGNVLSTKVSQDKPGDAGKPISTDQKDTAADTSQAANTAQAPVLVGLMSLLPNPAAVATAANSAETEAVDALNAIWAANATTTAQTGKVTGQSVLKAMLPATGESDAQGEATETVAGKPAFLAILNVAKEQGPQKATGVTTATAQPAASNGTAQQASNVVTAVVTDPKVAVNNQTVQEQGDAKLLSGKVETATITEEAQNLMPVNSEKKPVKSTEAVNPNPGNTSVENTGKEQAVPAVAAMTNGAADQKNEGQGSEHSLTAETVKDANAELPEKAKANETTSFTAILDSQNVHTKPVGETAAATAGTQAKPDTNNVFGQIVDQAKLITRANNSEMVIKLNPEHLGELTLKVAIEGGTVSASFHSSNSDVRAVIESTLPQLKQELSNQGLKVEYVGVYASLDQFSPKDHQSNAHQQTIKLKKRSGEQFEEAVEATATVQQTSDTGVDYRV